MNKFIVFITLYFSNIKYNRYKLNFSLEFILLLNTTFLYA